MAPECPGLAGAFWGGTVIGEPIWIPCHATPSCVALQVALGPGLLSGGVVMKPLEFR